MDIRLSHAEQEAKDFVLNLIFKGTQPNQPCDVNFQDVDFMLPIWYDDAKFKCDAISMDASPSVSGQNYFQNNRFGVMTSNMYGLFSLISEPMGAKILDMSTKSSNAETARNRYSATTLYMLSWYQDELKEGSNSWNSLKKVRKMHQFASKAAEAKGFGNIPQTAMSVTVFGFLGYALIRPHLLAIRNDNDEEREGFVHLWAVIGSMLGIKDEFNMCLHRLEVVEMICHILNRYLFIPLLQLENPTFAKLGTAFVEGMSKYIPFSSFSSRLFLARRLAGVPGYQYDVDLEKEFIIRQIFTPDELKKLQECFQNISGHEYRKHMLFDENMYLLDFKRIEQLKNDESDDDSSTESIFGLYKKNTNDVNNNDQLHSESLEMQEKLKFFGLQHPSELLITKLEDENMEKYQNDRKFKELSRRDQFLVKYSNRQLRHADYRFLRPGYEALLSLNVYFMRRNTKLSYS